MDRIVLCENDFPRQVLPADWTEMQANELLARLNQEEWIRWHDGRSYGMRIYYHWKTVPETGDFTLGAKTNATGTNQD